MKTFEKKYIGPFSLVLLIPALILCGSGILYLFLGFKEANGFLESLIRSPWTGFLFSPVVVLGGACLSLLLNASKVFRITVGAEPEGLFVSIRIRTMASHLLLALTALSLLALLVLYAFVENFQILPRA